MADYLLRAPEEDMARWKATAARRGRPFSKHIRICLERHEMEKEAGWPTTGPLAELGEEPFMPRLEAAIEPVEAAAADRLGPDGAAASTGDRSSPEPGPVSDPAGSAPVDLQARAAELAAKLGKRVEADPK